MTHIRFCVSVTALAGFTLLGCGGSGDEGRVPVYKVSGTIMLSGSPVPGASVTFSPKEGAADEALPPVATGRTDTQGKFQLTTYEGNDGAAVGDYIVLVSKSSGSSSMSQDELHEAMSAGQNPMTAHAAPGAQQEDASILPVKYKDRGKSGLEATVTADGENVFEYDLTP